MTLRIQGDKNGSTDPIETTAIDLARNGFNVTADLVSYEKSGIAGFNNFLVEDPSFAIDFAPNGTLLGVNDTITRRRYADTLETIAKQGPDAFYTGPIANATIKALQAANGTMTLDDLKNYTVAIRKPAQIEYRDFRLSAVSAPGSGVVALSVLKKLEGYGNIGDPAAINLSTHRLDEAIRFAYGEVSPETHTPIVTKLTGTKRANLGDPSFVPGLDEYQLEMVNETTAEIVRSKISDTETLETSDYNPSELVSVEQ